MQVYDSLTLAEWETSQKDVPFYLAEARIAGGPLLELGCGTGRLLIPLLSTGFEVSGLDASAAMLEVAKQKREQLSPELASRLQLYQGDMSSFELGEGIRPHFDSVQIVPASANSGSATAVSAGYQAISGAPR